MKKVVVGFFTLVVIAFLCSPLALYLNARPDTARSMSVTAIKGLVLFAIVLVCVAILFAAVIAISWMQKNRGASKQRKSQSQLVSSDSPHRLGFVERLLRRKKELWS